VRPRHREQVAYPGRVAHTVKDAYEDATPRNRCMEHVI
jgi:hypothetical protein